MTLDEFVSDLGSKSLDREAPMVDDHLVSRIKTALRQVATRTTPLTLMVNDPRTFKIMRRIDESTWIREPETPNKNVGVGIDMDEQLMDAVEYYVMAGLEPMRGKIMMALFHSEIDNFNQTLIEAELSIASHDSIKHHQFP